MMKVLNMFHMIVIVILVVMVVILNDIRLDQVDKLVEAYERIDNQMCILNYAIQSERKKEEWKAEYMIIKDELNSLIENRKLIVALDSVVDNYDVYKLKDIIKEIGFGSVLRSPFNVTAQFGESVGYHGRFRMNHTGIDIVSQNGDFNITPFADGKVIVCTIDPVYGKTLIIQHSENVRTKYSHGSKIFYRADLGMQVSTNDIIMVMGDTGHSDGIHLHFEIQIKVGNEWVPIDPRPFLLQQSPKP